jgi:hypothetical protein
MLLTVIRKIHLNVQNICLLQSSISEFKFDKKYIYDSILISHSKWHEIHILVFCARSMPFCFLISHGQRVLLVTED